MASCSDCHRDLPGEGFAFCPFCGAAMTASTGEQRKTVTVLFADLVGSTQLGADLDPEVLRGVMQAYWTVARTAIERHGGSVAKFIGDAAVGVFGVPVALEDDAIRAIRAARDLVADVAQLSVDIEARTGTPLAVRLGVNTGPAIVDLSAGDVGLMVGDVANMGARLEAAAPANEIYLGETTARLVRDAADLEALPPLTVKGRVDPLVAYRVVSVHDQTEARRRRRFAGSMVGRRRQAQQARIAYETALDEQSCALLTVVGDAGVGKSRLVDEFIDEVSPEATVLFGRALPYGDGIAYWPLAQALRCLEVDGHPGWVDDLPDIPHADAVRMGLETITGLADAADATQMSWAFRTYLEVLARRQPVVLVLDDLQWADDAVIDIVESMTELSREASILIVCMARPELLQRRPTWGTGRLTSTTLMLTPLGNDACHELLTDLLGEAVPIELRDRIVRSAEGNPLFLEEVVASLAERGTLREVDGHWELVEQVDEVEIPPTVLAVLTERLDHLPADARRTLEVASVIGQVFYPDILAKILDGEVDARLAELVRLDLIRPTTRDLAGVDAYSFCHLSVQATAYDAMPYTQRADVHRAVATWLDQHSDARSLTDLATYHLERSAHYRRELGQLTAQEAEEVVGRLRESAFRTINVVGSHVTLALLDSALPLASGLPELAAAVQFDRARALWKGSGAIDDTVAAIDQAREAADAAGSDRLAWRSQVLRSEVDLDIEPGLDMAAFQSGLEAAAERLQTLGDAEGVAEALALLSVSHHGSADPTTSLIVADRALESLGHSTDPLSWLAIVDARLSPYMSGPRPLHEEWAALAHVRALLDAAGWGDDPRITPYLTISEIRALGRSGRLDEAQQLADEALSMFEERGHLPFQFGISRYLTEMYWHVGDLPAAEHWCRVGLDLQRSMGSTSGVGQRLVFLAMITTMRGDLETARTSLAERSGIPDANECRISRAVAPAVEGLIRARDADSEGARAAFDIAFGSLDGLIINNAASPALLMQSVALSLLDDVEGATSSAQECLALAEWLEWVPAIDQASRRLAECTP